MREDTVEKFQNRLFILQNLKTVLTDLFCSHYFADDKDMYLDYVHLLDVFEKDILRKLHKNEKN